MKKFLTSKEAADFLGISETELQELVDKGKLPSYKIGGIYTRFKIDDLDFYCHQTPNRLKQKYSLRLTDRIKDFFYFNDFYIFSVLAIIIILYFIFR